MTRHWVAKFFRNAPTVRSYAMLGCGVLAHIRDQQPSNSINKTAACNHRREGNHAFGVERIIRQIGLRDGLKIKLLPLRLNAFAILFLMTGFIMLRARIASLRLRHEIAPPPLETAGELA